MITFNSYQINDSVVLIIFKVVNLAFSIPKLEPFIVLY